MKEIKKYLLLAIMLIILILFGIQRNISKQQYKINSYSLAIFVDGEKKDTYPERGNYNVSVDCRGKANGSWDYNNWGLIIKNFNDGAACNIIFTTGKKFNEYIIDASRTDSNIIYMEQPDTVQTGSNAKEEYRYTGANPNNYVYFGCDSNCTEDNLYRIIGVLPTQKEENGYYENRVKLIKATEYQENESGYLKEGYGYDWNTDGTNNWEYSKVQINVLNGVYWKSLSKYQEYIEPTVWYLGAIGNGAEDYLYKSLSAKQVYQYERGNIKAGSGGSLQYTDYIGLMYPSDYGFSISTEYCDLAIDSNYSAYLSNNAWLYQSYLSTRTEWLITPDGGAMDSTYNSTLAYRLHTVSNDFYGMPLYRHWVNVYSTGYIRPTFNLKANVMYKSGDGTSSNPYRIEIN